MIQSAEQSVGITVFFKKGITQEKIDDIGEQIVQREEVKEIQFISAEEAWEQFKEEMFKGKEKLLETYEDDNPLADSACYEITLNDVTKQKQLVKYIKKLEGVRQVKSSDTTAQGLSSFNLLVGYVSIGIIAVLIFVAVFLISTTVTMGISIRKDEITIMRLIGASDYLIRAPFVVEGVIIGLVGSILPLFILYILYEKIVSYIMTKFSILTRILNFIPPKEVFFYLIPISICIGVGIGFLGSTMTVRRHLRSFI